ncbi:MAG TPA: hypothetical protein PK228_00465, partial [Saprospiraceae bacterium]|nr:hypothetical protein [Saprospiraceae bacterium]
MRKKFNTDPDTPGDRFEFREEYWEQAKTLIEAEEARRRKRRRWLLWWLFAGLLVGAGCWVLAGGEWQWGNIGSDRRESRTSGRDSSSSGSSSSSSSSSSSGSSSGQPGTAFSGEKSVGEMRQQGGDGGNGLVVGEKALTTDSVFAKTNTGD